MSSPHEGLHVPMVTAEEFQRVQEIFQGRKRATRARKYVYAFTWCIRCESCGCSITAERKRRKLLGGGQSEHLYYHCTHGRNDGEFRCPERGWVTAAKLEGSIVDFLASVTVPSEFAEWARQELQSGERQKASESESLHESLNAEIKKLQRQRENLTTCLIEELIEREEFERRKSDLDSRIKTVKKRLEQIGTRSANMAELLRRAVNLTERGKARFIAENGHTKKTILLSLGNERRLWKGKLTIEPYPWLVVIQKARKTAFKTIILEREVNKSGSGLPDLSDGRHSKWSGVLDDLRNAINDYPGPVNIPDLDE